MIQSVTWMNLKNTVLSEELHTQETVVYMILIIWNSRMVKPTGTVNSLVVARA